MKHSGPPIQRRARFDTQKNVAILL